MQNTAVALGFFDGLHLGHRAVIEKVTAQSGLIPTVVTFNSGFLRYKSGDAAKALLSDSRKAKMLDKMGVKAFCMLEFKYIKDLTPEEFVKRILIDRLGAKAVSCGYNFHFGKNAQGNADTLREEGKKYGLEIFVAEKVTVDSIDVSSTVIKNLLSDGGVDKANKLLGYDYTMKREVCHGKEIGRIINFPTINQRFVKERFLPKRGVYASVAEVEGKKYMAVTNIGINPTVADENDITAETNIIGYNGDLYGKAIPVSLVEYIREEKKFDNIKALAGQIEHDRQCAVEILKTRRKNLWEK